MCALLWCCGGVLCPFKNVPVCPSKTSSCARPKRPRVCRHHAHTLKHLCDWCRHTRRRFERTHGDVLDGHTGVLQRVTPHTTPHTHHNTRHNTTTHNTTTKNSTTHHNNNHHHNNTRRQRRRETEKEDRDRERGRQRKRREDEIRKTTRKTR